MSQDNYARQAAADADYWAGVERADVVRRHPIPKTDAERGPFAVALVALLRECRMSQSTLANRAALDHSYVSRLASGARTPSREAVVRLADAIPLGVVDRDRLLAAAGFLPRNGQQAILDADPALVAAVNLLGDDAVPVSLRDSFREQLFALTNVYRLASWAGRDE